MVELHAWATIRDTYDLAYDPDNEAEILHGMVSEIREYCENLQWDRGMLKLEYYNGEPYLSVALHTNHMIQQVKEVIELFAFIGKIAIGSYGLIYMWDDEDVNGQENTFQVYRLARGCVDKMEDTFLSPVIPTIEDPMPSRKG